MPASGGSIIHGCLGYHQPDCLFDVVNGRIGEDDEGSTSGSNHPTVSGQS